MADVNIVEEFFPEDEGHPAFVLTCPEKSKASYTVRRMQGGMYPFFSVSIDRGPIPEALQGQWTKNKDAVKAVQRYLLTKRNPNNPYKNRDAQV